MNFSVYNAYMWFSLTHLSMLRLIFFPYEQHLLYLVPALKIYSHGERNLCMYFMHLCSKLYQDLKFNKYPLFLYLYFKIVECYRLLTV